MGLRCGGAAPWAFCPPVGHSAATLPKSKFLSPRVCGAVGSIASSPSEASPAISEPGEPMHAHATSTTRLGVPLALLLSLVTLQAPGAQGPQAPPNHLRWQNRETALSHAAAWQEARGGRWVTVVLLTDRPVPSESLVPGEPVDKAMTAARAQGIAFTVMTGGVPLPDGGFDAWFLDGADLRSTTVTGAGGFEIESQGAAQIKGRAVAHADGTNEFAARFDAPVLHGDAKRMAAEGEALGAAGGAPAKDLQIAQEAARKMDFATISACASSDLAEFLRDAAKRPKNLEMLRNMTAPQVRIVGGLRNGDRARVSWVAIRPGSPNNRCVDDMELKDGKWRSASSACAAE